MDLIDSGKKIQLTENSKVMLFCSLPTQHKKMLTKLKYFHSHVQLDYPLREFWDLRLLNEKNMIREK